jgi:glutamate dehydrogenase
MAIPVIKEIAKQQQEEQESLNMLRSTQSVIHEALHMLGFQDDMFELLKAVTLIKGSLSSKNG